MKIITKTLTAPCQDARFLAIILNICDKIANSCKMDLFDQSNLTIEEIRQSPEVLWLNNLGNNCDFEAIAAEELPKSQEIFNVFFPQPSHRMK